MLVGQFSQECSKQNWEIRAARYTPWLLERGLGKEILRGFDGCGEGTGFWEWPQELLQIIYRDLAKLECKQKNLLLIKLLPDLKFERRSCCPQASSEGISKILKLGQWLNPNDWRIWNVRSNFHGLVANNHGKIKTILVLIDIDLSGLHLDERLREIASSRRDSAQIFADMVDIRDSWAYKECT